MNKIKDIITTPVRFVKESISELRKVTWPTPKKALELSFLVAVVSVIFSIFISGVDLVFKSGIEKLAGAQTQTQTQTETQTIPTDGIPPGTPPGGTQ